MDLNDQMQPQARALADPSRFKLFRFIAEAEGPVGVAELTDLLGFNHNAIRQHLAVLTQAGLVAEFDEQRATRGRPRKQYRLRHDALSAFGAVSGGYQRLAELLLELSIGDAAPFDVGYRAGVAAHQRGDELTLPEVERQLFRQLQIGGFEPVSREGGVTELKNCPFADVAGQNPGVVCELHRGLINGFLAARAGDVVGELVPADPHDPSCLVTIVGPS